MPRKGSPERNRSRSPTIKAQVEPNQLTYSGMYIAAVSWGKSRAYTMSPDIWNSLYTDFSLTAIVVAMSPKRL